jgi:Uma2 family endonuclease
MTVLTKTTRPAATPELDWSAGWRYEWLRHADGTETAVPVPLTAEEIRHPQEGYVMPIRTSHDRLSGAACDMLRAHFADQPDVAVFHDLIFEWDHPEVGNYAPDIAVVFGVRQPEADRSKFVIAAEGTRPALIIEVTSPTTRTIDRSDKVKDYALVGVQEYVYIDHWTRKNKETWEIAGFRLVNGYYLPIVPDEDGAIYCATIAMRIGVEEGQIWLEDAATGENLLTNLEVRRALRLAEAAQAAAEKRANAEEQARRAAEARIAELEARLRQPNEPTA